MFQYKYYISISQTTTDSVTTDLSKSD